MISARSTTVETTTKDSFEIVVSTAERILRHTPLVVVAEHRCPPEHPQFESGGPEKCPFVVFSYTSVRFSRNQEAPAVFSPNEVNFLDKDDVFQRRPVSKEGAVCDWIALAPDLLRELASDADSMQGNQDNRIFPRAVAPLSPGLFAAQRAFFNSIRCKPGVPRMRVEGAAMALIKGVLESSRIGTRTGGARTNRRRRATGRTREMVEEAKCVLALDFSEKLSIADVAKRVHCSAGYISNCFKRLTGTSLHQYQLQLKLRTALQMISEGRFNGAAIASQVGFASHSHFSNVFGGAFGLSPKQFARVLSRSSLEEAQRMLSCRPRQMSDASCEAYDYV